MDILMKSGRRAQKRETDDGQAVPRGNKPLVDGSYSNVFANPSSVLLLQFESVRTKMSVRECLSFGGVYMSPARCASVCLGNRALRIYLPSFAGMREFKRQIGPS